MENRKEINIKVNEGIEQYPVNEDTKNSSIIKNHLVIYMMVFGATTILSRAIAHIESALLNIIIALQYCS